MDVLQPLTQRSKSCFKRTKEKVDQEEQRVLSAGTGAMALGRIIEGVSCWSVDQDG